MITKETQTSYRIDTLGSNSVLIMSESELIDRLRKRGIWSEDQIQNLISQDVGYETVRPFGKYT